MSKLNYYKLSSSASVFYDPKSKLKVTNKVPGKVADRTESIKAAMRSGHIIAITETEYDKMMGKLPEATQKVVNKYETAAPKPKAKKIAEVEEDL